MMLKAPLKLRRMRIMRSPESAAVRRSLVISLVRCCELDERQIGNVHTGYWQRDGHGLSNRSSVFERNGTKMDKWVGGY